MAVQEELLEEIDEHHIKNSNIEIRFVLKILIFIVIALCLLIPKIYISTNIYYKSLELSKLKSLNQSLTEENRYLKQEVEQKKFNANFVDKM
jgi:cell division protein FtsL